ncbi:MAG: hypothetical protein EOO46_20710 [Flavobacterium sp.]|nr:MAG: hypothetical protein EOO46_20710 [Flavobacterium sp.]
MKFSIFLAVVFSILTQTDGKNLYNLNEGKTLKPFKVKKSYSGFYTKVITAKNDTMVCVSEDDIGEKAFTHGKLFINYQFIYEEDDHAFLVIVPQYRN